MTEQHEYDAIADRYRESKRLLFRRYIERYTLFEVLGALRDRTVLDLACGEGVSLWLAGSSGLARRRALLDGTKTIVIQAARAREMDGAIFKYVGVSGIDKRRIVQVGVSASEMGNR